VFILIYTDQWERVRLLRDGDASKLSRRENIF